MSPTTTHLYGKIKTRGVTALGIAITTSKIVTSPKKIVMTVALPSDNGANPKLPNT